MVHICSVIWVEKKTVGLLQCKGFKRRLNRQVGITTQACLSAVTGDVKIAEENSASRWFLLDMFLYCADWEGFLWCRCWIGRSLCRYLSTLRQGQGITETSTVFPWFPVQLCLPPTPRIVICWPSVTPVISGRAEDKQKDPYTIKRPVVSHYIQWIWFLWLSVHRRVIRIIFSLFHYKMPSVLFAAASCNNTTPTSAGQKKWTAKASRWPTPSPSACLEMLNLLTLL